MDDLTCCWCRDHYLPETSHAHDREHFCTRKCEGEARFWLYCELQKEDA